MGTLVRHLVAIAVLPLTVAVLIPIWLGARYSVAIRFPHTLEATLLPLLGLTFGLGGLVLAAASVTRFAREGQGTLAPWDPPRSLVVGGAYGHVRHPMISGVALVLIGESLMLWSAPHALWAATFVAMNVVYLRLVEEPGLERRFGDAHREYKRHVPALIPRLRPWRP
jgi:protein-S-isoprenylcysteine O-methyltransferase Ste14